MAEKAGKRMMVVLANRASEGKSETLREFAKGLVAEFGEKEVILPEDGVIPNGHDFIMVARLGNQVVGVISAGDFEKWVRKSLSEMIEKYEPSLIFCASRTKGGTVHAVDGVAADKGYEVLWSSTYFMAGQPAGDKEREILEARRKVLNHLRVGHLREMMGALLGEEG